MSTLTALLVEHEGGYSLQAPAPGRFTARLRAGERVAPGVVLGTLWCLDTPLLVVAPSRAYGVVEAGVSAATRVPRAYGAELMRAVAATGDEEAAAAAGGPSRSAEGALVIRAPMPGVVYLRPAPDEPLFVAEGERIEQGRTVALLEVMKVFSPVRFRGDELPSAARVVALLAENGAELAQGDPILALEPVTDSGPSS